MALDAAIEAEAQAQAICMQTQDFRRAYDAFAAKAQAGVRRQLTRCQARHERRTISTGRSSTTRTGRSRASLDALVARGRSPVRAEHARRRRRLPRLVRALGDAGWLRYCVPAAHGGALPALDRARSASRARRSPTHAGSPTSRSRCRASAAARSRSSAADGAEGALAAARSRAARRSPRSRSRSRRPAPTSPRWRRRARRDGDALRPRRREDVDLERRHRRLLRRLRAHRRGGGRARHLGASSSTRDAPGFAVAERIEVIAPHPLARLEFDGCRVPARCAARRRGRGLQARDAHARRLPRVGRRGGARASRGARSTRRSRHARARQMFGATLAELQLTQAKLADMATDDRCRRAARLPRGVAARRAAARASRARRRWRRWRPPRRRSG